MDDAYIYTPGSVETLSGVSTDAQRDWRHRGFLVGFGQEINSRWKFSLQDVVALRMANTLMQAGADRFHACQWGRSHAEDVVEYLRGNRKALPFLVVAYKARDDRALSGSEIWIADDMGGIAHRAFDRAEVINFEFIARKIDGALAEEIQATA